MPTDLMIDDQQLQKHLEPLKNLDGYRRYFMDVDYWRPYVQIVCQRHQLTPYQTIRTGLPGCYPTFIVDDRWVVKFFGQLFDGALAFEAEKEVNQLKGCLNPGEKGIVVSLGGFAKGAHSVARSSADITLIDAKQFVSLFLDHYDKLESSWQARFPLKMAYMPNPGK